MSDLVIETTIEADPIEITVEMAGGLGGGGGAVTSVNGETGAVVLGPADVGAAADDDPRLLDPVGRWQRRVMPPDPMDELVLVPVTGTPAVPYTVTRSVSGGVTVSSEAANTNGNIRALYCLPETYRDVEVHVVVSDPGRQSTAAKLPQFGAALRIAEDGAGTWAGWTSTFDIISAGALLHNRIWNWGVGGLRIDNVPGGAGETTYSRNDRGAAIRYVASQAGVWILGLAAPTRLGGNVTIAQSGVPGLDGAHVGAVAWTADFFGHPGPCLVIPGAGDPHGPVPSVGKVVATDAPDGWVATEALFPLHMAARVVGDTIWWRTWADGEPDPGWGGASFSAQRTITSASDGSGALIVPDEGMVGFFVNHMAGATGSLTYDVEVRPL